MQYKRKEPFRFHFQDPIPATYKILKIYNENNSKIGRADILDVSPNGVRFKTDLNLPVNEKNFLIEMSFSINKKQIRLIGDLIWKKTFHSYYIYGLVGRDDAETKLEIIEELKGFARVIQMGYKK
ncbi:PilZ domain-containing protein [Bacillus sp. CGMCC 1.16607]|uniref:PilZ domain-containing protein n=1 Tax=Bacillus sp. CGMCC 1.16607 TaxID=3351842 RepID=UPI00362C2CA3